MSDEGSDSDTASYVGEANEALDGSMLDVSITEEVTTQKTPTRRSCSECGKTFTTKAHLTRHLKSHVPNSIRCTGCHLYFQTEQEKNTHIQNKHSNNIWHVCGKGYKRPSDLNVHLRSHEENVTAKFSCPFEGCTKTFLKLTFYQDHLNNHTGQDPYECQSCTVKFKSRYERNSHYQQCAGLRDIRCDICNQTFAHRASLHHHKAAKHTNQIFRCGCGATYKYAGGLSRHKKNKGHL